ncbi:MAG TPA: cytochrome P450 [Pyrinomonadaceae bacterium]|nr:cytochrome P450 [Pyrinomonadaceae bacterium]
MQTTLPPSQKPNLIGGHFRKFRQDPTGFLTAQAALGDVSFFRMGSQKGFFLNHPDLVRDLFVVNAHKFMKGRALQRAKNLLGEGLLTSEGEFHLRQRRMIQPAFHRARIADYATLMVEFAEKMSASWTDGAVRDIDKEMMHLTLQIVGKTLFNAHVEDDADAVGKAMTTVSKLFDFLLLPYSEWLQKLPLPQTRRFQQARSTLNKVIYGIIEDRRRSGEDPGDLLSMLLNARDEDDGGVMTDEQIRDEALTLFLAGHETTSNALTFTWYLLAKNPDKAEKLHRELDAVLGRNPTGSEGDPNADRGMRNAESNEAETRPVGTVQSQDDGAESNPRSKIQNPKLPCIEDVPNLRYTEAVLAESMRLYPPAWAIGRLALEDHRFGKYEIPARSLVLVSPYVTQRDPRFWDNPDEFIPERWETHSVKEASQKNIYFPFGGGIRRCIGEGFAWTEGILLLATLAKAWKLSLVPEHKLGLQPLITLRPKYGMRMRIEKRVRE